MQEKLNIPFSPPDITESEIEKVCEVLQSGWITTGPKTKEFEKKLADYIGTKRVVCLNSATAALETTLRVLGIGKGDEVIVPAYTYTASCSVICHVGATPVILDIQKDHHEMDYNLLEQAITEKTKAIISVDLAGIMCDYEQIYDVVNRNKGKYKARNELQNLYQRIIVVADAAHALGSKKNGVKCGLTADFTCYSFHAVKNLTTAEGGAVTWKSIKGLDDDMLYQEYQLLSLHGQSKDALSKMNLGAWEYDIISPAYKCNMTDIMAAIGIVQLERYPKLLERRKYIIQKYDNAFDSLPIDHLDHYSEGNDSSGHLYLCRIKGITIEERNQIITSMAERGIATNVHYKPLPMMTAYKKLGFNICNYPNSYQYYANEITLPLNTKMTDSDVDVVILNFKEIVNEIIKC
ncbi:DegT/DnrJ/EryC1/StrS family aminotransferase [[Clostridium] innocuum]|nr:DegT/DnrJ/EryC1/StrS family aminotransferase [[Clostridium] innocuum]MCR0575975.1 DegT/DnrJ/EryC1/StrS family aminotransferase [[Clostridium] innocuum]